VDATGINWVFDQQKISHFSMELKQPKNRDLMTKPWDFVPSNRGGTSQRFKARMFKKRLQKPMRTLNSNCKSKRGSSENGDLIRH
jgi:hypothetical protein